MHKLVIHADDHTRAHHFAGLLGEVMHPAAEAVSIFENGTRWLVEGFFADQESAQAAAACLSVITATEPSGWLVEEIGEHNWVALSQAALPPVLAGRFTIYGSHDRAQIGRGPNRILIDAGEAFGTAHHATTYSCLLEISRLTRQHGFKTVLDLGTGSGVLALALHRAFPGADVLATDSDAVSIEVAEGNARLNGDLSLMHGRLRFIQANGLRHSMIRIARPLDLIVANILAGPLIAMAGDISLMLRRGGTLLLSGILTTQARSVVAAYTSHGLRLERHTRLDDWSTLLFIKRVGLPLDCAPRPVN